MPTAEALRVLFYSHDTYGLGHIRRTLAIGEAVLDRVPGATALVLTGASALRTLKFSPGIDYVKLPCVTKVADEQYAPKFLGVEFDRVKGIREQVILSTARAYRPTAVLVDNVPLGMGNELVPTLGHLSRCWPRPRVVLTLRDVIDSPPRVIDAWRRQGTIEALRKHYDDILVYGTPDVFDLVNEYGLPDDVAAKVRYAGYIDRPVSPDLVAQVRARHAADGEAFVLVTVGGGADGATLVAAFLRGLDMPGKPKVRSLVVLGPDMPAADRDWMRTMFGTRPDVTLIDFCDQMTETIAAADAVVSMGGYNTVCELLATGTPAVIVPRVWPRLEQWIRCERLASLGQFRVLHPDGVTPASLWRQLGEALSLPRRRLGAARLGGLGVVTSLLSSSFSPRVAVGA